MPETISVLLVDDERDFHLLAKEMLRRLGSFELTSATSVEEALELFERNGHDIVVADYFMPGTSGIELLRKLRAAGSDVPFVMFTGKGREDVAIDALNSGADFYIQKGGDASASFASLSKVMTQLVHARTMERRNRESLGRVLSQLQELGSIVNQSPVIVMTWSVGDRWPVTYVSENVSQLGYSAEDFTSGRLSYLDIVHPDDCSRLKDEISKYNDSGLPVSRFNYRVLTKSGEVRLIDERTVIIRREGVPLSWQGILLDVTDQKLAERRIRDLAMIVDSSHDAIYGLDLEAKVTSWNRAAEELYGYPAAEVLGTRGEFLVPENLWEELESVRSRVRSGERVDNYETVRIRKDGTFVDVSITLSPLKDDSGEFIGFSVIARDISESKKAERLLVESELKYRMLFDGANEAIYVANLDGRILDANKMACEQTGYTRRELMTLSVADIESLSVSNKVAERIETVRNHAFGFFETIHRRKDGTEYPVEVNAKLIEYSGGPAIIGMVRDISERKMSEEALRTVMSSLEDLESIVTSSPAVVFQWSYSPAEGRHVQFVSNNVQQFGYVPSELVSQVRGYDEFIHPDDRASVASEISKFHRTGADEFDLEYRIVTKDGSHRWVDDRTTVVLGDSGSSVRHRGIVMDITARKQAEDALRVANEKLSLLGSITRHDVVNQLGIVLGALTLLQEDVSDDQRRIHFRMMQEAISTISQQLEFAGSYQKAGTRPPEWVHVRLDLAAAMSATDLGHVSVEGRVGNVEVWADPMFEKVLFNLFDNSIRHGKKVTRIVVSTERRGDDLVIVYEDDGVGVPAEEKELIFGQGYGKNTGHGLFLSREILRMTGMTIVENGEEGKGSRFEIFVPEGRHRG